MNIEKIKNFVILNKNKPIKLRFNGNRNQVEEFDGTIIETYKCIFLVKQKGNDLIRSFSYTDILIGNLELKV